MENLEKFIDLILPTTKTPCSLADCTPGKIFIIFSILGIAGSMGSWKSFVTTVLWDMVIGVVILRLCRGCDKKWPWVIVTLAVIIPVVLMLLSFSIGAITSLTTTRD